MPPKLPVLRRSLQWSNWLDVIAIAAWGVLFFKYWLTGSLGLLIHPNYFGLTIAAGLILLAIAGLDLLKLLKQPPGSNAQHFTLLPARFSSTILLIAALVGLLITPRPFSSDTAIQRGLQDPVLMTRVRPQTFRVNVQPEARSLIDWIRTLDVYPEPDAYAGQPVDVEGFVVHSTNLPETYFTLTRFVITCCAADAYPVGLPVKLTQNRQAYPVDQWVEVKGQMSTEMLNGKRQLVIKAKSIQPIAAPKNPYAY